jgi:hypothetical protein
VRKRPFFMAIVLVGVAAALSATALGSSRSPSRNRAAQLPNATVDRSPNINSLDFPTPCIGSRTTIAEAESWTSYSLLAPHDELANETNVTGVWICRAQEVAVEYTSGVTLYMGPNTLRDAEAVFRRMAQLYPEFSVGKVRGHAANLIDPAKSTNGTAKGGVDFIEDGIRVTVLGNGSIQLPQLVDVADSLSERDAS